MDYKEASEHLIKQALKSGDGEMLKAIKVLMDTASAFTGKENRMPKEGDLHSHPDMEGKLGVPKDHVIIDRVVFDAMLKKLKAEDVCSHCGMLKGAHTPECKHYEL